MLTRSKLLGKFKASERHETDRLGSTSQSAQPFFEGSKASEQKRLNSVDSKLRRKQELDVKEIEQAMQLIKQKQQPQPGAIVIQHDVNYDKNQVE